MLQICHAWAFLKRSNSWSGTAGGSSALGHGTGQGALRERGMGRTWSENGDQYHPISHGTWQYQEHLPFISIYFNHFPTFSTQKAHTEPVICQSSWHRWRFQPSCCWSSWSWKKVVWRSQGPWVVHGTMAPWDSWDPRRSWLRSLPGGESAASHHDWTYDYKLMVPNMVPTPFFSESAHDHRGDFSSILGLMLFGVSCECRCSRPRMDFYPTRPVRCV